MQDSTKELLFNIFSDYEEYDEIDDCLQSYLVGGTITNSEYDYIIDNFDLLLNEWEETYND